MADNVHPAVVLIVERMKSHPEEFMVGLEPPGQLGAVQPRWGKLLGRMDPWLTPADRAYLDQHFRALAMERIHHDILDELLNGPSRRQEQEEKMQAILTQKLASVQQQQLASDSQNWTYTSVSGPGLRTTGPDATTILDELWGIRR